MPGPADETKLRIYLPAPGYQDDPEAQALKAEVEAEYGLQTKEVSMGRGAEGPALLIELVVYGGGIALWALSKGKEIKENLEFLGELYKRLKPYFKRGASFDREGAYVLAVNEITKHLGRMPASIKLMGYKVGDRTGGGHDHLDVLTEIEEAPPSGYDDAHQFQFKVDGRKTLKAIVEGNQVTVIELPRA